MDDLDIFGITKVALAESFVKKMPVSLNKEQYFEESFQDLKIIVSQDGECGSYYVEGLWEAVVKAQCMLRTCLKKWSSSRTLEEASEKLLDTQEMYSTCFDDENISSKEHDDVDLLPIIEKNISVHEEEVAVTEPIDDLSVNNVLIKCSKCSLLSNYPKLMAANESACQCSLKTKGGGIWPTNTEGLKLLEEKSHPCSSPASLCGADKPVEATDSPDLYYDQITSAENEVYMDIQLEHNYNHLKTAKNKGISSDIDEPTVENEIYMDITLAKPNDNIFTDPNLPVTLVVAKEDDPEVLQLGVNETDGLVSPGNMFTGERKFSSDYEEHLKIRRKKYEDQAPFKYFCNQCSFKTKRHSHMRNHSRLHERICTIYSCDQCDFSTIRASHLQRHLGSHQTELFACSECTYSTHSEALFNKHQRLKHTAKSCDEPKTKDIYPCLQCEYTTTSEKVFKRHLTVHMKKGRMKAPCFKCSHCSYQSPSRSNYYRHLTGVHGDERPFLCTTCGLCFKRSDTLAQHQNTHGTKESVGNMFQCPKCQKLCRSANALKEHELTHEEERRYLCEICAASFKTRTVQRKHYIQKHVHAKVNQCPTCSKSFTSKYLLKRHMKVHNVSQYNTENCTSQVTSAAQELHLTATDPSGWCDSVAPVQSSSDVQVFVVHQEASQPELSVQEGPLFQVASSLVGRQTLPVPVIPVEYVISAGDTQNQNCHDETDVVPSGEGEIITLAFVEGD